MKETSLLRRYRWLLFAFIMGGAQLAGTAFYYHDKEMTQDGIVIFCIAAGVAVFLNSIDEQRENDRSGDNVMGEIMPPQEETEGGMG